MKHIQALAFTGPAAIAALAFLVACDDAPTPAEPVIRPVRVVVVEPTGGVEEKTFSGVSQAGLESRLSFKVRGTVTSLKDRVGTRLKKGELIAEVDRTDYELQVQTARASLASANAQARRAESEYERTQQLFTNQNASRSQLEAARASVETARANVSAASKQVRLAQQQLSYTRLASPVAGVISRVHVEVNENVGAGAPVVSISAGSRPKVTVTVPDKLFGDIKVGDEVAVAFDAIPGAAYQAVVSEVAVQAGRAGAPVTAVFEDADDKIKPGLAANVTFTFGSADDEPRIYVPPVAVAEDRDGRYGFVFQPGPDDKGIVKRVPLTVGELSDDGILITAGLEPGQLLVTAGVSRLTDGMQVRAPANVPAATNDDGGGDSGDSGDSGNSGDSGDSGDGNAPASGEPAVE